jgi:hypothetical protein
MKKFGIYSMAVLMLGIGTLSSGCFGKFALVRKVYAFNDGLGNKFVKSLVFWAFYIIPVYGVCAIVDVVILNLIEFWTGSNPVAMGPNDKETQTVIGKDGNSYEITATQNRFDIVQLTGVNKGTKQSMLFNPSEQTCSIVVNGKESKLVKYNDANSTVQLFRPDGSSITVDENADMAMVKAMYTQSDFAMAK